MEKSVKDANAQMAKEKRDRDIAQRKFEQLQATTNVASWGFNDDSALLAMSHGA